MIGKIALLVACLPLAACAGPVEGRFGAIGEPLVRGEGFALAEVSGQNVGQHLGQNVNSPARAAVVAALQRQGLRLDAEAPTRIVIGFTARPAASDLSQPQGGELSPATPRWALQSCHHTIFRLTLAYARTRPHVATGRAAAEESRCHGDAEALLPQLADRAVAVLLEQGTAR